MVLLGLAVGAGILKTGKQVKHMTHIQTFTWKNPLPDSEMITIISQQKIISEELRSLADRRIKQHAFFISILATITTIYFYSIRDLPLLSLAMAFLGITLAFLWKTLQSSYMKKTIYMCCLMDTLETMLPLRIYSSQEAREIPATGNVEQKIIRNILWAFCTFPIWVIVYHFYQSC